MRRIGILGGTFDPIHKGHINIAIEARKQYDLDEVHILTGGIPPHKREQNITEASIRHRMCELAVKGIEGLIADDFELSKKDYTYTVKILRELKEIHSDWEIYFIIGEDSLCNFHLWREPEEIVKLCILLAYPRDTENNLENIINSRRKEYNADIRRIDAEHIDVSSTKIRKMIANNEDVSGLVCDDVIEYIKKEGLYKNGNR